MNAAENNSATPQASGVDLPSGYEISTLEIVAKHGLTIGRRLLREVKPYEVEISPLFSFISAGTELHTVREFMAAAEGSSAPVRTGYSQTGIVTRVGSLVKGVEVGDRVVAIGEGAYHATRTVVAQNLVRPLPEGVSPRDAAMAAMFCFALESVQKSAVRIGDSVVVFGAGMMGQMAARLYHLSGARVCVMDSNMHRLSLMPKGVTSFPLSDEGWGALAKWAKPHGIEHASICFGGDATEVIEKLKPSLGVAPDGVPHGRIVFPGGARITVLMASNMGNIELISSAKAGPGYRDANYEAGANYPSSYVRHPVQRNIETMLGLMKDGRLDLSNLITHTFPFAEARAAYDMLQQPGCEALAVLLSYGANPLAQG